VGGFVVQGVQAEALKDQAPHPGPCYAKALALDASTAPDAA
jgi:hypothetical protein